MAVQTVISKLSPREPHINVLPSTLTSCGYENSNGANASDKCLIHLVKTVTLDDMKECFINALAWVDNPFISGMKISVALDDAAPKGSEREKRSLLKLMETIDNVLIEILERLPKTLQGFEGGVDGCKKMLEPEADKARQSKLTGPLHLALYKQQFTETFCMAPLVFEYLSRQFVAGLPSMMDNEKVLRYLDGIDDPSADKKLNTWEHLRTDGFVASFKVGRLLQGIGLDASREHDNFTRCKPWEIILGRTVLPGAQFVCLGVLTRPESYYKASLRRSATRNIVFTQNCALKS